MPHDACEFSTWWCLVWSGETELYAPMRDHTCVFIFLHLFFFSVCFPADIVCVVCRWGHKFLWTCQYTKGNRYRHWIIYCWLRISSECFCLDLFISILLEWDSCGILFDDIHLIIWYSKVPFILHDFVYSFSSNGTVFVYR